MFFGPPPGPARLYFPRRLCYHNYRKFFILQNKEAVTVNIVCMEPLGVPRSYIDELAAPLVAAGHSFTYHESKETDEEKLSERIKDANILMLANQPLSAGLIRRCPGLKMLDIAFTGTDHVGLEAARERGLTVCNAAGYSTNAVAELTFGLAIAVCRNIVPLDGRARSGGSKDGLIGFELCGKTFGIIGTGAIKVASLALAFGCKVLAYSRTVKPELEAAGVDFVSLEEVLRKADFLSLHVPLTAATAGLIDARRLALMKPTAVLINTARGGVVDNAALAAALNAGRLSGAGIDVFEKEPPLALDHPLCSAKNTVLTPHVAFASQEALKERARIVFKNIDAYLKGRPVNLVK